MRVELQEPSSGEEFVIELGSIRLTAYLKNGKTTIVATVLHNGEFIQIQPVSANQVIIKADKSIR